MKKKQKQNHRPRQAVPPPSNDAVRLAAEHALQRAQLERIAHQGLAGQTFTLLLAPTLVDLLPGQTAEQVFVRLLVAGGTGVRGLAGGLGLPTAEVEDALHDLACGARVDWSPKGAPSRKAVE